MLDLPLRTPSLILRHFDLDDAEPILRLNAETTTRRWLPSHVYADLSAAKAALAFLISSYADPGSPRLGPYVLAVEHADTVQLLGHVGFSPLDAEVEVSYAIAESARGRGFGAEALFHACGLISRSFGLSGLVALTAAANLASRRTLERAHFTLEREESMRFQGVDQPVCRYTWQADACHDEA